MDVGSNYEQSVAIHYGPLLGHLIPDRFLRIAPYVRTWIVGLFGVLRGLVIQHFPTICLLADFPDVPSRLVLVDGGIIRSRSVV